MPLGADLDGAWWDPGWKLDVEKKARFRLVGSAPLENKGPHDSAQSHSPDPCSCQKYSTLALVTEISSPKVPFFQSSTFNDPPNSTINNQE